MASAVSRLSAWTVVHGSSRARGRRCWAPSPRWAAKAPRRPLARWRRRSASRRWWSRPISSSPRRRRATTAPRRTSARTSTRRWSCRAGSFVMLGGPTSRLASLCFVLVLVGELWVGRWITRRPPGRCRVSMPECPSPKTYRCVEVYLRRCRL